MKIEKYYAITGEEISPHQLILNITDTWDEKRKIFCELIDKNLENSDDRITYLIEKDKTIIMVFERRDDWNYIETTFINLID